MNFPFYLLVYPTYKTVFQAFAIFDSAELKNTTIFNEALNGITEN